MKQTWTTKHHRRHHSIQFWQSRLKRARARVKYFRTEMEREKAYRIEHGMKTTIHYEIL